MLTQHSSTVRSDLWAQPGLTAGDSLDFGVAPLSSVGLVCALCGPGYTSLRPLAAAGWSVESGSSWCTPACALVLAPLGTDSPASLGPIPGL